MSLTELEIRSVIGASRPEGDCTSEALSAATAVSLERTLGRPLDEPEALEVRRVVSRWFSEMCLAEALAALEADELEAEAKRSKPGG